MATKTNNYTVGRGKLYFSAFRPGTTRPSGFEYIGHTPEMGISVTTETLDHWNMSGGPKFKDRSITLSADFAMTFTTDNISPDNMAKFFLSEQAQRVSQAAATAQTQLIAGVALERLYLVGESAATPNGVKRLVNVSVSVDGTPLEAEVDYIVDAENGGITLLEGGAAQAGDDVTVSYGVESASFDRVISGNSPVRGALRFVAENATGDDFTLFAPCVELTPNGDYSLIGDEWQTLSFNVSVEKLEDRAALYRDGIPERV